MAIDEPLTPRAPSVSVVIVTFQSADTLGRCLQALKAQTWTDYEVLIADNASTDGAPQAAAKADPSLRLLPMGANLGFAAANNRAAQVATGRWLVLLNPDAYPEPDWLEQLLACAAAHPEARCFTSRQLMAKDPSRLDGLGDAMTIIGFPFRGGYGQPDPGPGGAAHEVFSPCGAAMMMDRALFLSLGGFDEAFFCYCEDVDLGYRLQLLGEAVIAAPAACVLHEGSASTGGRRSDFSLYYGARNRLWTFVKNTPGLLFWPTLPFHAGATAALWLAAVSRGEGRALGAGVVAGLGGLGDIWRRRRLLQAQRTVPAKAIWRLMVWNPLAAARRDAPPALPLHPQTGPSSAQ
ncbi:MAG TPA: glycosyltransferase family 2 protein [Caulobacteraceae bacterium]|nr:glycosyltransferase family 2 protein [Caulobacteraceae bacterium]